MNKPKSTLAIYTLALVLLILVSRLAFIKLSPIIIPSSTTKGFILEPETPTNIEDSTYDRLPHPENEVPIQEVLENGKEITFETIYHNPDWERPAFKEYWHSQYGRWSYVPRRIHYALHRVFSTYATASRYYDFVHDLGIAYESNEFNKPEYTSPFEYLYIVVMNTSIKKVLTYENQILIVGKPQRTGLQAIVIPTNEINPKETSDILLIQLITPDGYEIDYTTERFYKPDLKAPN